MDEFDGERDPLILIPAVSLRTPLGWQDDAEQRLGTRLSGVYACPTATHAVLG